MSRDQPKARKVQAITNSKLEFRNPKQFQMFKYQKIRNKLASDFDNRISDFVAGSSWREHNPKRRYLKGEH